MTALLRAFRRRILTPSTTETEIEKRGFHNKGPAATELLETVGKQFLHGYGEAVETRSTAEMEENLERVPRQFRGFAYEGAAMGCVIMDSLPVTRTKRLAGMLAGRGDDHVYMAYVGIGWAMARLPRPLWPDIAATDPLLRWLILDGYGFHQAYFKTGRYVHQRYQEPHFNWAHGTASYARRAIDQGIGRALWFIGGTDPGRVADLADAFPAVRHSDLYGGIGLAATYAAGASEEELRLLLKRAGDHRASLLQGSAFAAEARVRAGLVVPGTGAATALLCGMTPEEASELCVTTRPTGKESADSLAYEQWRRRIADTFISMGRC
ncbi:DUF1702 family protein [Streptomyces amakusaensis]|uniref:DUF1702 family protein n=1 Tax=Streptomyces amakusaensis TaxID=67271 RepID=A0ABW0ABY8_9ACTN